MAETNGSGRRQHVIRVMCHLGDVATRWESGGGVETDEEGQDAIRSYKINGQQLFFPNATPTG